MPIKLPSSHGPSKAELKLIDQVNKRIFQAHNPLRSPAEGKEQVIREGTTSIIKAIGDSAVGRAIKALKGKIS